MMETYKDYVNPQLVISAEELKSDPRRSNVLHRRYTTDV